MLPIPQAFDAFVRALQPNKARTAQAERMQSHVRAALRHHLPALRESFLTGSFARSTAIEPLADVDVFLVLDPKAATRATPPKDMLRSIQAAVKKAMPTEANAALQDHSIGLTYAGNDLRLDLVPALPEGEHYWIPDIPRGNWIRTSPRRQKALLDAADQKARSKLRPLIRLAKAARRKGFAKLGSYHLEVMALTALPTPPPDYAHGIAMLLAHLGDKIIQNIPDPTGGDGPRLTLPLAERQELQRRLRDATATAERALHLGATGALDKAHAQWRHLFGAGWPG